MAPPNTNPAVHTELPQASSGVDVDSAKVEFLQLEKQLSNLPLDSTSASSSSDDLEKATPQEAASSRFDLREYLQSSNDANQNAGIQHKKVCVTWEDLQVEVVGGRGTGHKFYIETFNQALMMFWMTPYLWLMTLITPFLPASQRLPTAPILHKSSGILKPGEMCLVLGCPGAGCTTFLKTIANQRESYGKVDGRVTYAGLDAEEMAKYYRGEVVYNEEDDLHIATLTVQQTMQFALSTKTPGPNGRLPGVSRKQFDSEVMDTLLRMLNISHTKSTLVGDAFTRGVSGGERKRVSIAEMMATRARVQCWDNSTRGLDASTALDFAKCLRIMTDVLGQTTFVTLYQAGEGIYDLFDKVLVLNEGRQVYFGPPSEARGYFEQLGYKALPRQSTPDYLTGCTDPNERQFAFSRSPSDVPSTPETLEAAFLSSTYAQELEKSRKAEEERMQVDKADQEAFRAAVAADRKKGLTGKGKRSPYTLGFWGQVKALTIRMVQQKLQDRFQLMTSWILSMVLALIIGGALFGQSLDSQGAFTRGSIMFISLFVTSLEAFGEMPTMMMSRPILKKQTSYRLYRPSSIAIAGTLADLPFSMPKMLMFNIIVYFMTNLHRSAGGFFTYHLFVSVCAFALQGLFRTLGHLCQTPDQAIRLATIAVPSFAEYSGYMIPVTSMKKWLFWIYYINPVAYAWQGLMENEFMRISLTCDGNSVVPRNVGVEVTKYPTDIGPNQACTLFGAEAGLSEIRGRDYLVAGYGIYVTDLWVRCLLVLLGFALFFQITQVIALEYFPQFGGGGAFSLFAKETEETKKCNEKLQANKARKQEERALQIARDAAGDYTSHGKELSASSSLSSKEHRKAFTFENLNYTVPVPGGEARILHDITGYVKPGTLTALMGASGAGKTTCLDVLAQRKNIGVITGDLLVDGKPLDDDFARGTAYAEQMDVHEGTATVREAMRFSAYLRQPQSVSKEEKDAYVEEMIELLELQDLADAIVFALGVEAKKRLTIGVELASKPELLLFLDEPTSGLDGQSAWNLVRFLRKLADQGQAILCTIHQPSSLLFESFDRLLLLERGGETVYFGDIGRDSQVIRSYFARHGALCPSNVNPAEYMLEAIGAGTTPRAGDRDWKDIWLESEDYQMVLREIQALKQTGMSQSVDGTKKTTTYATSFWHQLKVVVGRNSVALWRSPNYLFTRLFIVTYTSLFVSLSFLNLGNSVRDLQFRVFGSFWVTMIPGVIMGTIEPAFIFNRMTFVREGSSKMYSPYVFALGQLIAEVPYNILSSIVYWVLMVYPMGYGQGDAGINGTGIQLLLVTFTLLFGISLGQLIGALSPSIQVAVLFNPFLTLVLSIFAGVNIPYNSMITFWRKWIYELDPYTRLMAASLGVELQGLEVRCAEDEWSTFIPPAGQSCLEWAGEFVQAAGGYLENENATDSCRYCQYKLGQEFFQPLKIDYANRWRDTWILFAFVVFNALATIVASRFLRWARR